MVIKTKQMIDILLDNFVNDKKLLVKLPIIPRKGDWIHLEYNEEFTEGESYLNVRKVILTPESNIIIVIVDNEE